MESSKTAFYLVLVAIVIAIGGYFFPAIQHLAGEVGTRFPNGLSVGNSTTVPGGVAPTQGKLTIGLTGTPLGQVMASTCALIANSYTVAASSTVPMDCAVTNALSTDLVFAQFATSTQIGQGGWAVRGSSASSTNGFITITVVNSTGASNLIPASVASTTKYIILR